MGSILVPVDGSEYSENALEYAIDHHPDAEIIALHVMDLPDGYFAAFTNDRESLPQVEDEKAEAEALLEDVASKAEELGAKIRTDVEGGNPADGILSYVADNEIDEIVIGSRGLSGVGRIMFGSTAEKVVRRSEVPVTVVH